MASQNILSEILAKFYEKLLAFSERKTEELQELTQRPSKQCHQKFTLNLMTALELEEEVILAGLVLAKRVVDCNLKVAKRYLNR